MLRGGSADTIIARRLWCIRPSTPTFSILIRRSAAVPGGDSRYALVVSALVPYKRLDVAIDACRLAGVPLKIVGTGPERSRLSGDAQWLGRVSDEEVRELYRHAAVVLLPGEEDFGIVPLEAQACGRPVVALGRGGALETVVPGETGLLVDEQKTVTRSPTRSRARCGRGSTRPASAGTRSASAAPASAIRSKRWWPKPSPPARRHERS